MKKLSATFFAAALLFAISAAPLRGQNAASTNGSGSNAATASAASSTPTNTSATKHNQSSDNEAVRIDTSGVHVGAQNGSPPVDISWGNPNDRAHSLMGLDLIGLAAVVGPFFVAFALPVAIIAIIFFSKHRRNKMMHETIRAMVDKGMPVTPEVIAGLNAKGLKVDVQGKFDNRRPRNKHLLPALILIGVGLALTGFHPWHAGTGGKIVLFIGLAFLIVWLVEKKQNGNYEQSVNTERKQDYDQQPPKI